MTTPELEEPRWDVLNLAELKVFTAETVQFTTTEKTLKKAWTEVKEYLETKGDLPYLCGKCNSPIDSECERCWACGSLISDDGGGEPEEPEMDSTELDRRASDLGVSKKDGGDQISAVEDAEKKKMARRNVDIAFAESEAINQAITGKLPNGWSKKRTKQYTAYLDPSKTNRICVFDRGIQLHFRVDGGFFEAKEKKLPEGLEFLDEEERKKRHFGRANYVYSGDVSKVAIDLCSRVFGGY